MASSLKYSIRFEFYFLGRNRILSDGSDFLSNANWAFLKTISLDNNDLGSEGVMYLVKVSGTMIEKISLSILVMFRPKSNKK
jgi:hypothetical protein